MLPLRTGFAVLGLALALAACARPAAPPAAPAASTDQILPRAAVAEAQRNLNALGYEAGRTDGEIGPQTDKAIRAYQKDEKLPTNGKLTTALCERLNATRQKLPGKGSSVPQDGVTALYNEGSSFTLAGVENNIARWQTAEGRIVERPANFLLSAGDSETTDAPADFLQPLRPGAKGQYVLRAKTGDVIATTSCAIGRLGRTTGPAGQFDSIEAICHEERAGHPAIERHFTYAPELRLVIREETRIEGAQTRMRELVALRPSTQSWPKAAQIGLDWALSHALDESNSKTPLRWSSTAVKEHFTIRIDNATPLVVSSTVNNARCMRFELESGDGDFAHARYPGLACKSLSGPWVIPASSPVTIAYPNQGMAPRSAAAAQPATPQ